jgi:osmoprotectant transport system ATP-binding protein
VRPVAERHERALERVPIDRPTHFHQPARAEILDRIAPLHIRPAAFARTFVQGRRKLLVEPLLTARTLRGHIRVVRIFRTNLPAIFYIHHMSEVEFREATFGHARQAPILDGFTLAVDAGEVVALVGASGAGKTTALKLVNRLLLPDAGEVRVQGKDTREWDPIRLRRSVGYVIQEVGLFPHLTVADNVAVVPRLERWDERRVGARVRELLELIGLASDTYAGRWPDELSGGQRQRVGVARALAADPSVLLMDEPFGALDPVTRRQLQDEFRRIQSTLRKTVLLVTHDVAEAMALADRIGVLETGRLIWCGPARAIQRCEDPRVRKFVDAVAVVPRSDPQGSA